MSTVRDAELALTKIVAAWSGMVLGTSFFQGQVPDGGTGAAFALGAELPNEDGDPALPHFAAQVVGKFTSRATAQGLLEVLRVNLPAFGLVQDGIIFPTVLKRGEGAVVQDQDDGVKVWRLFYNLQVRFRD